MIEISGTVFLWVKALHVISVISWMAGLLYLPRLFVYHAEAEVGLDKSEMLKVMERRLLRAIMTPAMMASWIFGVIMAASLGPDVWVEPWFVVKLICVVAMSAAHSKMAVWRKDFAEDRNTRSHKFYRFANEVPTVLMIAIVIMVIVKPF